MQSLVGYLLWLSNVTRSDPATITSILSQHTSNPTPAHVRAATYATHYVKGTKAREICFSTHTNNDLSAYLHFPTTPTKLLPLCDANWVGQDQSLPDQNKPIELPLFTSWSISGFIVMFNGPLHWGSCQQRVIVHSSAEVEIYVTDEYVKNLLRLKHFISDTKTNSMFLPTASPIQVFNDNNE